MLRRLEDYRIDGYLAEIESHGRQITEADIAVWKKVRESSDAMLLMSIPWVGMYTALAVASEIGDVSRFADSRRLCSYAGIVPSVRSSTDVMHHGRITRRGSRPVPHKLAFH